MVCRDIPLQHQAVQATHAGIKAGRDLIRLDNPNLVLLTVANQGELLALSCLLTQQGVGHRVFHEDDMGGRATALGTDALPTMDARRRLFRKLKLYRLPEQAGVAQ